MNKPKLSIGLLVLAVVMVTGTTFANPTNVPDVGSTSVLMSMAFAGLAVARKLMR